MQRKFIMKIEKINDNQIRCTLSKKELEERQIKISELAYGSEKAKNLFQDMIEQANDEFGFEVNDMPIMVEAIPLNGENLVLQITKVEYPDEFDPRFSKFSDRNENWDDENGNLFANMHTANEIIALFEKSEEETQETETSEKKELSEKENKDTDVTRMFQLTSLQEIERISHILGGFYKGKNYLYKDKKKNSYFLILQKSKHSPEEFNKICNIISEYAIAVTFTPAIGAYLKEHGTLILKEHAIQIYASLEHSNEVAV